VDGSVDFSSSLIVTPRDRAFERLEAQITELWGYLNAATYKLLVLIAQFDRERAYERHGLVNTAQWLSWQCGIGAVAAREKVRVARALETLPQTSAAFASGEASEPRRTSRSSCGVIAGRSAAMPREKRVRNSFSAPCTTSTTRTTTSYCTRSCRRKSAHCS
jgi:hypothetical protein